MTTIVSFVVVLGILILVHEFGHFIVARTVRCGGRALLDRLRPRARGATGARRRSTACLSFPLGGYVKMMGDDENPLEGGKTGTSIPRARSTQAAGRALPDRVRGPGDELRPRRRDLRAGLHDPRAARWSRRWSGVSPRAVPSRRLASRPVTASPRSTARPVQYWEDVQRAVQDSQGETLPLTVQQGAAGERKVARDADSDEDTRPLRRRAGRWDLGARAYVPPSIGDVVGGFPAAEGRAQDRRRRPVARGQARAVLGRAGRGHPATRPASHSPRGQAGRRDAPGHRGAQRGQGARPRRQGDRGRAHRDQSVRGASPSSARTRSARSRRGWIARWR